MGDSDTDADSSLSTASSDEAVPPPRSRPKTTGRAPRNDRPSCSPFFSSTTHKAKSPLLPAHSSPSESPAQQVRALRARLEADLFRTEQATMVVKELITTNDDTSPRSNEAEGGRRTAIVVKPQAPPKRRLSFDTDSELSRTSDTSRSRASCKPPQTVEKGCQADRADPAAEIIRRKDKKISEQDEKIRGLMQVLQKASAEIKKERKRSEELQAEVDALKQQLSERNAGDVAAMAKLKARNEMLKDQLERASSVSQTSSHSSCQPALRGPRPTSYAKLALRRSASTGERSSSGDTRHTADLLPRGSSSSATSQAWDTNTATTQSTPASVPTPATTATPATVAVEPVRRAEVADDGHPTPLDAPEPSNPPPPPEQPPDRPRKRRESAPPPRSRSQPRDADTYLIDRVKRAYAPPPTPESTGILVDSMVKELRRVWRANGAELPLVKKGPCVYLHGTKKLNLAVVGNKLAVRTGGGHKDLLAYLDRAQERPLMVP